ncbi:MAG: DUF4433 domain-containing protein [Bacteroidota bacterium]
MPIPTPIHLFRMTHIDNVPHALERGLWTAASPQANPEYVPIGDSTLIRSREEMSVPIPPGGVLSDYIPFYFGARSPMLYVIKHGFNFVKQTPQSDIIYLIAPFDQIKASNIEWCFTDGNARDFSSRYYNQESEFAHIDWEMVREQNWANTEEDMDRKRRKQAEFLVKTHVPATCLSHIIVYELEKVKFVQQEVDRLGLTIQVAASRKHYY